MIKYFCDMCRKEVKSSEELYGVSIRQLTPPTMTYTAYPILTGAICKSCVDEMEAFIENKKSEPGRL